MFNVARGGGGGGGCGANLKRRPPKWKKNRAKLLQMEKYRASIQKNISKYNKYRAAKIQAPPHPRPIKNLTVHPLRYQP